MPKDSNAFVKKLQSLTSRDFDDAEDFFNQSEKIEKPVSQKNSQAAAKAADLEDEIANDQWLNDEHYEGQLAVDVFQTQRNIVIQSTIAGVRPEDLDISFTNDTITIRGLRKKSMKVKDEDYFYNECYWGGFSRSIILPVDVQEDKIDAKMENGILTVTIPKNTKPTSRSIPVKEIPI